MIRGRLRKLSHQLAFEMVVVTLAVFTVLVIVTIGYYFLDKPELRRLTLEMQVRHIVDAMRRGDDPTAWEPYRRYPKSYGFRVFNHRQAFQRSIIAQANPELLQSLETDAKGPAVNAAAGRDLLSGVTSITTADIDGDGESENVWLMTGRSEVGGHIYWVQAAMVDDPAWQWRSVLAGELIDHAVVPTLFIVPALMLAVYFAARRALRPLNRVASQASELGDALTSGRPFTRLSGEGLPLEFDGVVSGINAMLTKLDRSLALQKEFTSDVAHQLRTPLAVLLLEVSELPPGEVRDRISQELGDLAHLVNELLNFAQAEDAMARQRYDVDIGGVARKVCEDLADAAFRSGKQIELDEPLTNVVVSGHPVLIDVAIRNVVENAIKLAPPRSTISIRVDADRTVIVEDRGPGVPDTQKELIFRRFWRGDKPRTLGSGVGLALVRRIAFLHGGDIHVEDRPGGGARFVIALGLAA
ncbi:Signal transduction histidine kinase [Enhydrobacter aerosaccus]|uniref:histidine kinase n=1 Tax=Enhydrobacter aerosaccus TaxID=225324 RepID=A0A1T4SX07_9HYPH|nr:HAMP domain-containing sensor histidine kinase [Enhydrobacter aerosaccus]SKA32458.1 Signal transduction histidine kinase [Enhydrobacter aerosaccus]